MILSRYICIFIDLMANNVSMRSYMENLERYGYVLDRRDAIRDRHGVDALNRELQDLSYSSSDEIFNSPERGMVYHGDYDLDSGAEAAEIRCTGENCNHTQSNRRRDNGCLYFVCPHMLRGRQIDTRDLRYGEEYEEWRAETYEQRAAESRRKFLEWKASIPELADEKEADADDEAERPTKKRRRF